MDLKTYDREQFDALMGAYRSREHFKLSGGGIEAWYAPRGMTSGAGDFGPFVRLELEQLSQPVKAAVPAAWNGPEDGLPPVGLEFEWRYAGGDWKKGEALYIGRVYAVLKSADSEQHYYLQDMQFRPIRTAEQLAAEEREAQIRKMEEASRMHIGSSITRVICERLYDAGARMPVEGRKS